MTSYSVLPSGPRFTVLATWPGVYNDHTVKITTLDNGALASDLAVYLTRVSEGAWDAAPWLDTYPVIEAGIAMLIDHLRGSAHAIPPIDLSKDGYRHGEEWSFFDVADTLLSCLPETLTGMTRTQRLTIADEMAADAAGRAEAVQLLPDRREPDTESSRAWQALEVTRALRNGQTGPLPEGAAGWMVRAWGTELTLIERWAARDRLTRIEQLVAACEKFGGRARADLDRELCAHLVVPRSASVADNDVFYVTAPFGLSGAFEQSPNAPMSIRRSGSVDRDSEIVAVLEPGDDDGFAAALGEWTRLVPWSAQHVPVAPAADVTGR
ncbi:hypothetical protein ILP97_17475 [Amycolatopsis sp. H6(2020)]|nr:hypothetical protein [Amycolatopsis sp. H6(2020)]